MVLVQIVDVLSGDDIDFAVPVAIKRVKLSKLLSLTVTQRKIIRDYFHS
jgi:hypothetical protein